MCALCARSVAMSQHKARVVTTPSEMYQAQILIGEDYVNYGPRRVSKEDAIADAEYWLAQQTFSPSTVWEGEV